MFRWKAEKGKEFVKIFINVTLDFPLFGHLAYTFVGGKGQRVCKVVSHQCNLILFNCLHLAYYTFIVKTKTGGGSHERHTIYPHSLFM